MDEDYTRVCYKREVGMGNLDPARAHDARISELEAEIARLRAEVERYRQRSRDEDTARIRLNHARIEAEQERDKAQALAASLSEDWHRMNNSLHAARTRAEDAEAVTHRLRAALEDIRQEVGTSTRAWHLANRALTGEHCAALEE